MSCKKKKSAKPESLYQRQAVKIVMFLPSTFSNHDGWAGMSSLQELKQRLSCVRGPAVTGTPDSLYKKGQGKLKEIYLPIPPAFIWKV